MHNPPPAIDCLIIVKCTATEGYDFYLIELKNVKKFELSEIKSKFHTAIYFIEREFAKTFSNYCLNRAYFYFVSDVPRVRKGSSLTEEKYRKKVKGTKLDFLQSTIFQFRGKIVFISPELPNPMVKEC